MTTAYGREGAQATSMNGMIMKKFFVLAAEFLCVICGTAYPGHQQNCIYNKRPGE
jgi:hypothetical protein